MKEERPSGYTDQEVCVSGARLIKQGMFKHGDNTKISQVTLYAANQFNFLIIVSCLIFNQTNDIQVTEVHF